MRNDIRYDIRYDKPHRVRLRCGKWLFTSEEARAVEAQLLHVPGVGRAVVHEDNGSILVEYGMQDTRERVLAEVDGLDPLALPTHDDRDGLDMAAIDNEYQMKLLKAVAGKLFRTFLLPPPLRIAWTLWRSLGYLGAGMKALSQGKLSVEVLDATAIGVSLLRRSFSTAGDVMFLLHISDILMEYTQARTRVALRQNLSLFAEHVWRMEGEAEVEIDAAQIREGDLLKVYMGSLVPVDGEVVSGEASVNEASMTGESAAIQKHPGSRVYAATVVESGIIVSHGIASTVDGLEVRIGSPHFIFEDEGVPQPDGMAERIRRNAPGASVVYMSVDGALAAAICIGDPLRPESPQVVARLRAAGFERIVMLTGDSENAAHAVAEKLGLDDYYSQVLPEDKASYVKKAQQAGHKVAMVGDGINDSPALAAADVSVAMSDASDIARAVADISIMNASLDNLLYARELASRLMDRIHRSYRTIVVLNTLYIVLGVAGILQPTMSAILYNGTTVVLTAANTRNLVDPHHLPKRLRPAAASTRSLPAAKEE